MLNVKKRSGRERWTEGENEGGREKGRGRGGGGYKRGMRVGRLCRRRGEG